MLSPPSDLDPYALAAVLRAGWGLDADLTYAPVGFGGHHWTGGGRFVTAAEPRTSMADLRTAMDTAAALAAHLPFVLAPLPAEDGTTVRSLAGRWGVSVFPHIDGTPGGFFDEPTPDRRAEMTDMLAALHAADPAVRPVRHDPALADRAAIEAALADLDVPWTTGPHAEPLRALLRDTGADRIRTVLADYDRAADRVRTLPAVVTHGETHQGNVLRTPERTYLLDWDTVALAPPERDLWMSMDAASTAAYERRTGRTVDRRTIAFYRWRWDLDDFGAYVADLRRPHGGADADAAWKYAGPALTRALAGPPTA